MKRIILGLLLWSFLTVAPTAQAWFGAGSTPGWPNTTTGLRGEIALPQYKFAPDFYVVGDTVTINTTGFNSGSEPVTAHYYLTVSKVTEAPVGTNVTDGQPTTPGYNENQLYDFHQAGNDVQSPVSTSDLGDVTFPAGGQTTFGGSFTTTQTGYYQFDFIDLDPNSPYEPGHILSAGFFRVLADPNLSPNAEPDPSPSPSPSPNPSSNPSTGGSNSSSNSDNSSSNSNSSSSGTGGQVLGASTLADTGNASKMLYDVIMGAGAALSVAGLVLTTRK